MKKKFNAWRILTHNGWRWRKYKNEYLSITDEYSQYSAEFMGDSYGSIVVAIVSDMKDHLEFDGHYGVLWLEVVYENDRNGCYSYGDLYDMQTAIENAEENLLLIGMPFVPEYIFHGRNVANKRRRNEKLRKLYDLEALEKEE